MAIRMTSAGVTIEIETEADLRMVLRVMTEAAGQPRLPMDFPNIETSLDSRLRAMWRGLKPHQRRMLEFVASRDWVQDQHLRAAVGANTNNQLAGYWTGIIRNAKKHGVAPEQVFQKDHRDVGMDAGYWYRITEECRAAIRS